MARDHYWGVHAANVRVAPFSPNDPNPPGVPVIDFAEVMSLPLAGADTPGFTRADWITVGVVGVALVGLGVLLARSA